MSAFVAAAAKAPAIDFAGLSPLLALGGGAIVVLLVGLLGARGARTVLVPLLTIVALGACVGASIWQWSADVSIMSGALRIDDLALALTLIFCAAGIAAVLLSLRAEAPEQAGHGEYHALLLASIAGMVVLVEAQNLVTLFLGLELLSIPLYVLCATELTRERSLESGLKYLVIGSFGSATLLFGLAFLYGFSGSTDFSAISSAIVSQGFDDSLLLTGIGLCVVGLAFKASIAPFHQWTPDVYEGSPTPVTAFMSIATKAAAFGVMLRFFDVAVVDAHLDWGPLLAALAAITIVVGNVGALGQSSLKRMLAWSSVAQAGYLLVGVVVGTRAGIEAAVFYLGVYLFMNLAAFAVVIARERETDLGDDIRAVAGLGSTRPWLAWPLTIAMLSLAGIPATAGFIGKITLIEAAVGGDYTWLAIVLVLGSAVSLAYYLRVVAVVWMRPAAAPEPVAGQPAIAGGSDEADRPRRQPEVVAVAVVCAAATLFFGIVASPLLDLARDASNAITGIF